MSLFPVYAPDAAGAAADILLTDTSVDTQNLTTYTFAGQSLGVAVADRKIIIAVDSDTNAVSTITVATISASPIIAAKSGGAPGETAELWQADVPAGTTGDVVVTLAGAANNCGIGVFRVTGAAASANDTGSSIDVDPLAATLNIPANGIAVAVARSNNNDTYIWTNIAERYNGVVEASSTHSGASDAYATLQTALSIEAALSGGGGGREAMVCASFGPA